MLNPFDPKTALLAKHAQHVVLVHFPIALFITGVAFDLAAQWTKRRALSRCRLLQPDDCRGFDAAGDGHRDAGLAVPVGGQKLKGILLLHLVFGVGFRAADLAAWWVHFRARRRRSEALPNIGWRWNLWRSSWSR